MKKLILRNFQSPGDIVMLTAAVRELHTAYPSQYLTDVRTPCPAIWENNPHLCALHDDAPDVQTIDCHYPLIHRSNEAPYHFVHGFIDHLNEELGLAIRPTTFRGDIHLSAQEISWISQVEELTESDVPFWIVVAGGKKDFTIKWWDPKRFQQVIDHFWGRIVFVQVGEAGHDHAKLENVIDLRGKTDLRQLIRLVYHAQGVLCPVTLLMHLAAAVPVAPAMPKNRACVVVAGGREPPHWEAYPHHQFLHRAGALWCCDNGGCWKSRVRALGDGDPNDRQESLCVDVVGDLPKCMDLVTVPDVIRAIEIYFKGGALDYITPEQQAAAQGAMQGGRAQPLRVPTAARHWPANEERPLSDAIRHAFVTITDYDFFPGTLATVGSVREFAPNADVYVVQNDNNPLSAPQAACFDQIDRVRLLHSSRFAMPGRLIGAWELKAYAVHDLSNEYEVIIGIDSDCLLCSDVNDEVTRCFERGCFLGGKDGDGADYDASYQAYGIQTPACNSRYMSTSLFFCAVNDANEQILRRWVDCCNKAIFNHTGPYPGHGDQGVLNAVLYSANRLHSIELLENPLWSQHWVYWDSIVEFDDGRFRNHSAGGRKQRSFHCGGDEKYWVRAHRDRVLTSNPLQTYPYVWFLAMFWFGAARNWKLDPYQLLPPASHHLTEDLVNFLPQIVQIYPPAKDLWEQLTDEVIDRTLNGIPRAMSLGGGSMTEVIRLITSNPGIRRYVEIGGYEGGSILALALRFANRDLHFYCVESFMGNLDGTMDGHPLPSRKRFFQNLARYPGLRVTLIPGDSPLAATLFDDGSVDCVFIDGCHETLRVLRDIDSWQTKLSSTGIMAGDDYGWESVRRAIHERFGRVNVMPSGDVWWVSDFASFR